MNAVGALTIVAGFITLLSVIRLARRLDRWPQDDIRAGMFDGFRQQRDQANAAIAVLIAAMASLLMFGEASGWNGFGVLAWLCGAYLCTGSTISYSLLVATGPTDKKDFDPCWRALCFALAWPLIDLTRLREDSDEEQA